MWEQSHGGISVVWATLWVGLERRGWPLAGPQRGDKCHRPRSGREGVSPVDPLLYTIWLLYYKSRVICAKVVLGVFYCALAMVFPHIYRICLSGSLNWHWDHRMITLGLVKQQWRVQHSLVYINKYDATKVKRNTIIPYAYFLVYTVDFSYHSTWYPLLS